MSSKIDIFNKFGEVFGKEGDPYGVIKFSALRNISYPIELPLSVELRDYFTYLEFQNNSAIKGEFYMRLFSIEELVEAQKGWRWVKNSKGELVENEYWDKSLVIIGDRHGDAICVDTSSEKSPVFGSVQQVNYRLANSITDFLLILCECRQIEEKEYSFETQNDDCEWDDKFLESIRDVLNKHNPQNEESFFNFFFE